MKHLILCTSMWSLHVHLDIRSVDSQAAIFHVKSTVLACLDYDLEDDLVGVVANICLLLDQSNMAYPGVQTINQPVSLYR